MNKFVLICLLNLIPFLSVADDVEPDSCLTPLECISKIHSILDTSSRPGQYPSVEEQAIIEKLLRFGDEGMPFIINLLEEKDPLVARIGAVALRKVEKISPRYLPAIVEGLDKNVSWLAPALARVGTSEASEIAVERYLKSRSAPHNQEAYAIQLFGMGAVAAIIEAIKCTANCLPNRFYLLGSVLNDFKSGKAEIANQLIAISKDSKLAHEIRTGSLEVISFLGESAQAIESDILALKSTEQELLYSANQALIGIKSEYAASVLAEALGSEADLWVLRDIAELGTNGKGAGKRITSLLDSLDPKIQLFAARTLGYIEYEASIPKLIELLNKRTDVLIGLVAAESLGRMKKTIASPDLLEASQNHWHPSVRDAAQKALENIDGKNLITNAAHRDNFAFDYFSFQHLDVESCESVKLELKPEPVNLKLYKSSAKEKLEALTYKSVILSYGAIDEEEQVSENLDGVIEVNDQNIVEDRHYVDQIPQMALRVNNGWLAGSNRGEWGGELVFISDNDDEPQYILKENIEDIYFVDGNYIAITGLAHLTMNSGMIYKLHRDEDGHWNSKPWINLPGSPRSSWFVESGELLINTYGGGSLLLSSDGSFRMAKCSIDE